AAIHVTVHGTRGGQEVHVIASGVGADVTRQDGAQVDEVVAIVAEQIDRVVRRDVERIHGRAAVQLGKLTELHTASGNRVRRHAVQCPRAGDGTSGQRATHRAAAG